MDEGHFVEVGEKGTSFVEISLKGFFINVGRKTKAAAHNMIEFCMVRWSSLVFRFASK